MSGRPPKIMLSAGETSGDRLGAGLARAIRRRRPEIELIGMGGERMAEAGVRIVQDSSEISVVGLFEVLSHLPSIRRAMSLLERCLADEKPDLLVPIDFPDFNLRLAARAGKQDVPVVYYVSPQIWAWRSGRVHKIRRLVRRMLVLFPFETGIYEAADVPVSFVGYPVEPVPAYDRDELVARIGLSRGCPTVGLLPGSRKGEVGRQLPTMLAAARRMTDARPELQFVVPRASGLSETWLKEQVASGLPDAVVVGREFPRVLDLCDAAVVAAGTATLDAALAGLPSVVVYRMNALSYLIGRRLVKLEHVALPNLIAGQQIFPELIQHDYTAERVANEISSLLDGDAKAGAMRTALGAVRERLATGDAFDTAATRVLEELDALVKMPAGS